ncbi:hypothetical protein ACOBQB_36470 [Streptomyces sp. G5(2025)]|uniref:hypothetical protein n=1 Tax=Streptomyces sp. G5(2025) TaxID=3406628 RepID=UPI003C18B917
MCTRVLRSARRTAASRMTCGYADADDDTNGGDGDGADDGDGDGVSGDCAEAVATAAQGGRLGPAPPFPADLMPR